MLGVIAAESPMRSAGTPQRHHHNRRRQLRSSGTRRLLAACLPLAAIVTVVRSGSNWSPPLRLGAAILLPYAALKAAAVLRQPPGTLRRAGTIRCLVYLTVWPGMLLAPFTAGRTVAVEARAQARRHVQQGLRNLALGGVAMLLLAWWAPRLTDRDLSWTGIAALLLAVHLGYADVLSGCLRLAGVPVPRLFDDPLASRSLTEFWSRRWNLAFVEMDRLLFLPLLRPLGQLGARLGVFVVSGLLHELAISFPAGSGWGLPSCYFALQGVLVVAERRLHPQRWATPLGRLWTWAWLLIPLPLLFHAAFRAALVVPLFGHLHGLLR
jgi:alginate O-acetyltransferase complex protein AlgI